MSATPKQPIAPDMRGAHSLHRLVGRCMATGDDENGQPRVLIHTTREQLMHLADNLIFNDVEVTLHAPNAELSGQPPKT